MVGSRLHSHMVVPLSASGWCSTNSFCHRFLFEEGHLILLHSWRLVGLRSGASCGCCRSYEVLHDLLQLKLVSCCHISFRTLSRICLELVMVGLWVAEDESKWDWHYFLFSQSMTYFFRWRLLAVASTLKLTVIVPICRDFVNARSFWVEKAFQCCVSVH